MRWSEMNDVGIARRVRLLLTFWQCSRRRVICFWWPCIIHPWQCPGLDVRSGWCWWLAILGQTEGNCMKFHHVTQNSTQLKTYELFIFGIVHLIFSGHGWAQVNETTESKMADKGEQLCQPVLSPVPAKSIPNLPTSAPSSVSTWSSPYHRGSCLRTFALAVPSPWILFLQL